MEQPRFYRLQIIIPILASLVAVAFTTGYNDFYNKPDIKIEVIPDNSNVTVKVVNLGRAQASHMLLTIETPKSILNHKIFSTENLTISNLTNLNPRLFSVYVPRFVQGQGTNATFNLLMADKPNISLLPDHFIVYATYDQGSIRFPPIQTLSFLSTITFIILYVIFGVIIALAIRYSYTRVREKIIKNRLLLLVPNIRDEMKDIKKL
jgi:hypothetical protein